MILLDTNVLLRMTAGNPKIGKRARQVIDDAIHAQGIGVPTIVFLEAARLHWDNRVDLGMPPEEWRHAHIRRGVAEVHLTGGIAVQAAYLHARHGFHRDPGDQIIAATAIAERSTLATTDERILKWARITQAIAVLDATE